MGDAETMCQIAPLPRQGQGKGDGDRRLCLGAEGCGKKDC